MTPEETPMQLRSLVRSTFTALTLSLLIGSATAAEAVVLTTNFSDHTGLGYAVGTTQTIVQNDIRLQCLQGMYEVTFFPEVNLKDFNCANVDRIIQLDLQSSPNFNFIGFSIRDLSNTPMTVTSDKGGNFVVPGGFQTYPFSGPAWEGLSWVRFTYNGLCREAKFTSFSLEPVDVVPTLGTTWSGVKRLLQ